MSKATRFAGVTIRSSVAMNRKTLEKQICPLRVSTKTLNIMSKSELIEFQAKLRFMVHGPVLRKLK